MSGLSAVSDTAGKFTDEMLAKNFISIANGFDDFEKWFTHLEGHVSELSKTVQTVVAKTPKASKVKPFLVGAAVGVLVYRYAKKNQRKIEVFVENANNEVKDRVENLVGNDNDNGEVKAPPNR